MSVGLLKASAQRSICVCVCVCGGGEMAKCREPAKRAQCHELRKASQIQSNDNESRLPSFILSRETLSVFQLFINPIYAGQFQFGLEIFCTFLFFPPVAEPLMNVQTIPTMPNANQYRGRLSAIDSTRQQQNDHSRKAYTEVVWTCSIRCSHRTCSLVEAIANQRRQIILPNQRS